MPEHMPTAAGSGAAWTLPPMLASMQDLKSDLTYVSGLENQQRRRETRQSCDRLRRAAHRAQADGEQQVTKCRSIR